MLSVQTPFNINTSYQQSINACLQSFEQALEASYNRISDQIELIFAPFNQSNALGLLIPPSDFLFKSNIFELPSISNNQKKQLTQEILPLVSTIVSREVKKNEQSLNEKYKKQSQEFQLKLNNIQEKKSHYKEIIKIKQQEIKQMKILLQKEQIICQSPLQDQYNLKKFTFELMNQNSIKQQEQCYAIAINKDNSIVIAGCDKQIKVFDLKQGILNESQLLSNHQDFVCTLNFMKKSNHFVSGSRDKSIIIWQMNQNNQWNCQHKLEGHSNAIDNLLLNNNEDLIISGSYDSSIKFWNQQNGWFCQQTIIDHSEYFFQLSLNEKQDKLISCSADKQILVIEYSQMHQIWNVIQKIKLEQFGYRLCFINDNQFTFQPYGQEQMNVYELNSSNQQFVKVKQITVISSSNSCINLFPQQYLKCKCLLVNKNGLNINFIRKKENGDFVTEQTIQFDHHYIFGQLSDDGEYLITWDFASKEIKTRKYREL
ncbi:unnamed protein product [Paramecium pentaurelia]|uniref:WD domain, G-beta repeat protein n=1 Tax=Paramecium pentaurelia TaxID=43138 RepID=A0A8S1XTZ1_9CILI|nr:unnamed protein product [Paramecium pentaurelia]